MDRNEARNLGERPRFTTRIVFLETPEVAQTLERFAAESGRSVAAEIRAAVRYWIRAWEENDDD